MRNSVIAAAIGAALCIASAANAAVASGTIRSYDPDRRHILLENGIRYLLAPSIQTSDFKTGDTVSITWSRIQNGIRVAQNVRVVNPPANND